MKIKTYIDYFHEGAKKKISNTIHYVKNVKRYKRVFLSTTLSLVMIGSVSGIIAGTLIATNVGEDPLDFYIYSATKKPNHYNWLIDFSTSQGDPATRIMSGLVRPRARIFDGMKELYDFLQSTDTDKVTRRNSIKFKAGGKEWDLSNPSDLMELTDNVKSLVDAMPSDYDYQNDGLLSLDRLKAVAASGGEYPLEITVKNAFAFDGAESLNIYDKNEFTENGTNSEGRLYEFKFKDNYKWTNGERVTADDFMYQNSIMTFTEGPNIGILKAGRSLGGLISPFIGIIQGRTPQEIDGQGLEEARFFLGGPSTFKDSNGNEATYTKDIFKTKDKEAVDKLISDGKLSDYDLFLWNWAQYELAYEAYQSDNTKTEDLEKAYSSLRGLIDTVISGAESMKNEIATLKIGLDLFKNEQFKSNMTLDQKSSYDVLVNTLESAMARVDSLFSPSSLSSIFGEMGVTNEKYSQEKMTVKTGSTAADTFTVANRNAAVNDFGQLLQSLSTASLLVSKEQVQPLLDAFGALVDNDSPLFKVFSPKAEEIKKLFPIIEQYKNNESKVSITRDFLNFPAVLYPIVTNSASADEVRLADTDEGLKNAIRMNWNYIAPHELFALCGDSSKRSETKIKGFDLKFADSHGDIYLANNIGELCDQFTLFSGADLDNDGVNETLRIKLTNAFNPYWLFELMGTSVVFLPIAKDYLINLGKAEGKVVENNDFFTALLGGRYYAKSPETYLSNGPFKIISMGNTFRINKRQDSHLADRIVPNSITIRYLTESANNAVTLNYIRGSGTRIGLAPEWEKRIREDKKLGLADQITKEMNQKVVTRSFSTNLYAPELTNNYFRTPIGEDISWGDPYDANYPDKTVVKEYKLKDDTTCEVVDTDLYYPSLSADNFICGIIPEYKDFAWSMRRLISTSFDLGRAMYERGLGSKRDIYSFPAETLINGDLSYDSKNEEYTKTVAIALDYQQKNPVDFTDSIYDRAFTNKDGITVDVADRPKVSIYGKNKYDNQDTNWDWKSTRKVGFKWSERLYGDPSPDKVAEDPVTDVPTRVGFTPSYQEDKLQAAWSWIKSNPDWTDFLDKDFNFFVPYTDRDSLLVAVSDYWFDKVSAITNQKLKFNVKSSPSYYGSPIPWGQKASLSCESEDLTKEYSLYDGDGNPIETCMRNVYLYYFGWGFDYSDPKNTLAQFASDSFNLGSFVAKGIPRSVLEYWRQNILQIIDQDFTKGKISDTEKNKFISEVNVQMNALIRPDAKQTFADIINTREILDENDNPIPSLDEISGYARNKIVAQFEAWRLKEGLTVPFTVETKTPVVSRSTGAYSFRSTFFYDTAYNCETSEGNRTFTRKYETASGEEKTYSFTMPKCGLANAIQVMLGKI